MPSVLSRVDLPQPDGPMIATNSPCSMDRSMDLRAEVSTSSERNRRWMSARTIIEGLSAQDQVGVGRKPGVGGDHHPLAGAEALGHLHLLGVAAANDDGAAVRLAAVGAQHEGVGAAGG